MILLSFLMCSCNKNQNVIIDNANNTKSFLKEDDVIVSKYESFLNLINNSYTLEKEVESNAFNDFKKNIKSKNYKEYSFVLADPSSSNEAHFAEVMRYGDDYEVRRGVILYDENGLNKTDPSPVATQVYVDGQLYEQYPDSDSFDIIEYDDENSYLGVSVLSLMIKQDYEALESYLLSIENEKYIATHVKSKIAKTDERYFIFDNKSNLIGAVIDLKSTNKIGEFIDIEFDKQTAILVPDAT